MKTFALVLFSLFTFATSTTLGDIAASMKAGEWRKLPKPSNASSIDVMNIAVYADNWVWNPITKKGLFVGSYHNGPRTFAIFDDATYSWSAGPLGGSGPRTGKIIGHGYDDNALDPATGNFYYRDCTPPREHFRYTSATNSWFRLPGNGAYRSDLDPTAFFPELGGLVWVNTQKEIYLFREDTLRWSRVGTAPIRFTTWNIAEYNPVHKVMIIASSSGEICKLSATGQVTRLKNMPVSIYNGSGFNGHVTVDPVSGDFLVLTPANKLLHTYDVVSDTWSGALSSPPKDMQDGAAVAASVETYGINLFMGCARWASLCTGDLYAYKHTDGLGIKTKLPGQQKSALSLRVFPNPFQSRVSIQTRGLFSFSIFDARGGLVFSSALSHQGGVTKWNASNHPPGMYLLKGRNKAQTVEKKLLLVH